MLISEHWLRQHDFKWFMTGNEKHWRRAIGTDKKEGRGFMESSDDLCIELAWNPKGDDNGWWYCWIAQVEPRRHIHVRHMREVNEIAMLYLGLTGVPIQGLPYEVEAIPAPDEVK